MSRPLLIENARCVLPGGALRTNVLVEDGRIAAVDAAVPSRPHDCIDARGLHLLPGVIDDQVHFREPGFEHKETIHTGSRACAKGGVTTFLEMPNTRPATITLERLDEKLEIAARTSLVNYGFYIGATPSNQDVLSAAVRTPGIKIFIGSSTGDLLVDEQDALERIFATSTLPITAHCEDEATIRANTQRILGEGGAAPSPEPNVRLHSQIRDVQAAIIATRRAVDLALRHKRRFHVLHVSTAEEARFLADVPRGLITAEACVHHLVFHTGDYARLGTRVQMNPSIKERTDNEALWSALHSGALQVVATDHAPHTLEEKSALWPASPSGLPAVENSLSVMLDAMHAGRCTLEEIVHWMCEAPARTWDIVGKGRIEPTYDADFVLVDLERRHTVRDEEQVTRSGWSPWHGTELRGMPVMTIVGGQIVFDARDSDAPPIFHEHVRGKEAQFDHARGGYWATESD